MGKHAYESDGFGLQIKSVTFIVVFSHVFEISFSYDHGLWENTTMKVTDSVYKSNPSLS